MLHLILSLAYGGVVTWYADSDVDGHGDPGVTLVADDTAYPSGFVRDGTDCDDASATIHPSATETCNAVDDDCDGVVDQSVCACKQDFHADATYLFCDTALDYNAAEAACVASGYHLASIADAAEGDWVWATGANQIGGTWWLGGNDQGTEGTWVWTDGTPWGTTNWYPGEPNNWNGDEDCLQGNRFYDSTWNDSACAALTFYICESAPDPRWWYPDVDGDGHGTLAGAVEAVTQPAGTVLDSSDCDDANAAIFPGALEQCNGIDDDCNGLADDNAIGGGTWYLDVDLDGYGDPTLPVSACTQPGGTVSDATDCNDTDAAVHPGATETCNGVDDDCNGPVDDNAVDQVQWYVDDDNDGFGDPSSWILACVQPVDTATNDLDCDDTRTSVNPGAPEVPGNGIDDDCDGLIDGPTTGTPTGTGVSTSTGTTSTGTTPGTDTGSGPTDTGSGPTDTGEPSGTTPDTDTPEPPAAGQDREFASSDDAPIGDPAYNCGCAASAAPGWLGWMSLLLLLLRRKS